MGFPILFVCDPCCEIQVPGFRPGKTVPESILIGYVGKQSVQKATVESILKRTLPHAMSSVYTFFLKNLNLIHYSPEFPVAILDSSSLYAEISHEILVSSAEISLLVICLKDYGMISSVCHFQIN